MKKMLAGIAAFSTAIALLSQPVNAQSGRSSGVGSLATQTCRTIEGNGGIRAINETIPAGRNMLTAVSILGVVRGNAESLFDTGNERIRTGHPLEVVCSLAGAGEAPMYRTLTLAFGYRSDGQAMNNSTRVRLSIFLDGNLRESQTILPGDHFYMPLDITNKRSVSLRADCYGPQNHTWCPNIYFSQDTLER